MTTHPDVEDIHDDSDIEEIEAPKKEYEIIDLTEEKDEDEGVKKEKKSKVKIERPTPFKESKFKPEEGVGSKVLDKVTFGARKDPKKGLSEVYKRADVYEDYYIEDFPKFPGLDEKVKAKIAEERSERDFEAQQMVREDPQFGLIDANIEQAVTAEQAVAGEERRKRGRDPAEQVHDTKTPLSQVPTSLRKRPMEQQGGSNKKSRTGGRRLGRRYAMGRR